MNSRGGIPIPSCMFTPNLIKIQWAVWALRLATDGQTDRRTDGRTDGHVTKPRSPSQSVPSLELGTQKQGIFHKICCYILLDVDHTQLKMIFNVHFSIQPSFRKIGWVYMKISCDEHRFTLHSPIFRIVNLNDHWLLGLHFSLNNELTSPQKNQHTQQVIL